MSEVAYGALSAERRGALHQFIAADHDLAIRLGVASHETAASWILEAVERSRTALDADPSRWWEDGQRALKSLQWNEPRVTSGEEQPWYRDSLAAQVSPEIELNWGLQTRLLLPHPAGTDPEGILRILNGPPQLIIHGVTWDVMPFEERWRARIAWRTVGYVNDRDLAAEDQHPGWPSTEPPFPVDVDVLSRPSKEDPRLRAFQIATALTKKALTKKEAEERTRFRRQRTSGADGIPVVLARAVGNRMAVSESTARRYLIASGFELPWDLRAIRKRR